MQFHFPIYQYVAMYALGCKVFVTDETHRKMCEIGSRMSPKLYFSFAKTCRAIFKKKHRSFISLKEPKFYKSTVYKVRSQCMHSFWWQ